MPVTNIIFQTHWILRGRNTSKISIVSNGKILILGSRKQHAVGKIHEHDKYSALDELLCKDVDCLIQGLFVIETGSVHWLPFFIHQGNDFQCAPPKPCNS